MNDISNNSAAKMDAIREILFGQTVKEYSERIEQLEQLLKNQHEQSTHHIDTLQSRMTDFLEKSETQLTETLNKIEEMTQAELRRQDMTHVDRKQLSEILIQLGKHLNPAVR